MKLYYLLNNIWVYGNYVMILPCLIAGINRFFNKGKHDLKNHLWTDYLTRICLIFTISYYIIQMYVKHPIEGINTVCYKAFFAHHLGTIFILFPLIINRYVAWWINPIGFLHGFLMMFPEQKWLNYVYVVFLFIFQYGIYQTPFKNLRLYGLSRFAMNFIWVFALLFLMGDCSNFLPLEEPTA